MKQRIWELDALRGLLVLVMVGFHLWYDLVYLFDLCDLTAPGLFHFLSAWTGVPFIVISGICVTLGSHPVRRGLTVFGGAVLISAVTAGMYMLSLAGSDIIIYFGVLHCLGTCMLLWPLMKKLPTGVLLPLGAVMIAAGLYLRDNVCVSTPYLTVLGVPMYGFASSDYFPLLPNLGYFLLGAALGRLVYASRRSLLPKLSGSRLASPFEWLGRNCLVIYLLHQPVLAGVILLITLL